MNYEYKCPACNTIYNQERSINEPEIIPACAPCGKTTQRVWTSTPVIFNAPGFYSRDNRKNQKAPRLIEDRGEAQERVRILRS